MKAYCSFIPNKKVTFFTVFFFYNVTAVLLQFYCNACTAFAIEKSYMCYKVLHLTTEMYILEIIFGV